MTDDELCDSEVKFDLSNEMAPIFVNQTENGVLLSMPESDFQHDFVEKFKMNNRNADRPFCMVNGRRLSIMPILLIISTL